ncbi:hypothetical protein BGZ58_010913 [Dissophora ornata]|nr:hypothetical protein BGZ58_010913 [Dissophora ornata]
MKINLNFALAVTALISATTASPMHLSRTKRSESGSTVLWTYGQGNAGPQHWGTLDPLFSTCGTGVEQSPIDVAVGAPYVSLQKQQFNAMDYSPLRKVLCGFDGHAVKCEWNSAAANSTTNSTTNTNTIQMQNKTYTLSSFHLHTPSEHRIDHHFADAEMHLVHKADDGSLAVVGVMIEIQAKSNPFFDWVVNLDKKVNLAASGHGFLVKNNVTGEPLLGKEQIKYKVNKIDFAPLLKSTGMFTPRWEYAGSLTTPPCTEGVAWNVVKTPVGLGLKQYDALVKLQAFNSRFLQDRPNPQ